VRPRGLAAEDVPMDERNSRYKALIEIVEVWSFPSCLAALIAGFGLLWYLNSDWRSSNRQPQVAVVYAAQPSRAPVEAGPIGRY